MVVAHLVQTAMHRSCVSGTISGRQGYVRQMMTVHGSGLVLACRGQHHDRCPPPNAAWGGILDHLAVGHHGERGGGNHPHIVGEARQGMIHVVVLAWVVPGLAVQCSGVGPQVGQGQLVASLPAGPTGAAAGPYQSRKNLQLRDASMLLLAQRLRPMLPAQPGKRLSPWGLRPLVVPAAAVVASAPSGLLWFQMGQVPSGSSAPGAPRR